MQVSALAAESSTVWYSTSCAAAQKRLETRARVGRLARGTWARVLVGELACEAGAARLVGLGDGHDHAVRGR
jgi:hypothetical protein